MTFFKNRIVILFLWGMILSFLVAFAACEKDNEELAIGRPAPNFTYVDLNGERRELKELEGKVVLLRFWADWCKVCATEMPVVERVYREMKDRGFTVLAVNVKQSEATVRNYVDKLSLSYPMALDSKGKIADRYSVRGLPWNYLITREGILKDIITVVGSEESLREFVEPYMS